MTPEDEIRRGERAEMLLKDEVLLSVFRDIKEECTEAIWGSQGADHAVRERLYQLMRATNMVKARIEDYVARMSSHKQLGERRAELAKKADQEEMEIARQIDLDPKYFVRD